MPTFTQIGSAVVVGAGGSSSITFSSIPSTFTDLVVVGSSRSSTGDVSLLYRLNGSSSNYTGKYLGGTGSAAESGNLTTLTAGAGGTWGRVGNAGNTSSSMTSSTFSNWQMYFPNYAGSTNKSSSFDSVVENNATTAYAEFDSLLWTDTSAITSIAYAISGSGSFVQYSTFYLYGVSNA